METWIARQLAFNTESTAVISGRPMETCRYRNGQHIIIIIIIIVIIVIIITSLNHRVLKTKSGWLSGLGFGEVDRWLSVDSENRLKTDQMKITSELSNVDNKIL